MGDVVPAISAGGAEPAFASLAQVCLDGLARQLRNADAPALPWEGKTPSERSSRTLVDVMQASENRPRLDFAADRAQARGGSFQAQCAVRYH